MAFLLGVAGWAQIVGGGFPKPSGAAGVQTVTYSHVSSIFSEVTHGNSGDSRRCFMAMAGIVRSPLAGSELKKSEVPSRMVKRDDFAWLSVVYTSGPWSSSFQKSSC